MRSSAGLVIPLLHQAGLPAGGHEHGAMRIGEAGGVKRIGEDPFPESRGEVRVSMIEVPGGELMGGFETGAGVKPATIDFAPAVQIEVLLRFAPDGSGFRSMNEFVEITQILGRGGEQLRHGFADAREAETIGATLESIICRIEDFLNLMERRFVPVFPEESIRGVLPCAQFIVAQQGVQLRGLRGLKSLARILSEETLRE